MFLFPPIIWFVGMVVFYFQDKLNWRPDRVSHHLLVLVLFAVLMYIGFWKKDAYCIEFILCSAALLLLITTDVEGGKNSQCITKCFRSVASTTYSLYLVHYSILEYFVRVCPQMDPEQKFWLIILSSEAVAIVFSFLFENKGKALSGILTRIMHSRKATVRAGALLGILCLYSIAVNSLALCQQGDYAFKGQGTRNSPYVIGSTEDFVRFRDLVNSGESFSSRYFYQSKDLDLSGIDNWEPIGKYGSGKYFEGYYNGGGHAIHNLNCVMVDEQVGLFGFLTGEVRNLGIESGFISGGCVGSIASHGSNTAKIINCYNKAVVHGTIRAGGIADNFAGEIFFCLNLGDVSCEIPDKAAGLVSYGCTTLLYSYSTKEPIVATGFSGNQVEVKTIAPEDLNEEFLKERHKVICSWWNNFRATGNIIRMTHRNGIVCMKPNLFGTSVQVMKVLACVVGGLSGIFLYQSKYRNKARKTRRNN